MPSDGMKRYWDERAEENAYYYVDNRLEFGSPDAERFWADGERVLDELLDSLGAEIVADDRIVEIGCGVGRLTRVMAARGASVRALDVSERMLALAEDENPGLGNVEWILGDGSSLTPLADGSADACISFVVFQHIPDPEITLEYVREMGRVLAPGGWSAFQISNAPDVHRRPPLHRRLAAWLRPRRGRPTAQAHPAWRGSSVELGELRRVAAEGGLEVERLRGKGTQFCLVLLRKPRGEGSAPISP